MFVNSPSLMGIALGTYKHYKGNLYEVIGVGRHSETHEDLIVYRALYDSAEFGKNALWIRPKEMFFEELTINGKKVLRFEYAGLQPFDASIAQWNMNSQRHLYQEFSFTDFVSALAFTNAVGELAEEHNHHPLITLTWGKVGIELWTHSKNDITEKDIALAKAIDKLK